MFTRPLLEDLIQAKDSRNRFTQCRKTLTEALSVLAVVVRSINQDS